LDYQNKIYPIIDLLLGEQTQDSAFFGIYAALPNFHSIRNACDEAFCTGKMGEEEFNYDQIRQTLAVVSRYPNQGGVITEWKRRDFARIRRSIWRF
jgi:hypothetical protein